MPPLQVSLSSVLACFFVDFWNRAEKKSALKVPVLSSEMDQAKSGII
jgi:hypothetical protein